MKVASLAAALRRRKMEAAKVEEPKAPDAPVVDPETPAEDPEPENPDPETLSE